MTKIGGLMEVILYCQDMNTQVSFYRDKLALDVKEPKGVQDFAGVFWVELETGCCTLALHAGGRRRLGQDAPKIVFRVADVAATRQELVDLGVPMAQVRSPAEGILVCDGLDPEGNKFSIESRVPRR